MTAEKVFQRLSRRYGDEFNWHVIPVSDTFFVSELKKELGKDHILFNKSILAVAKCDARDDVLYLIDNGDKTEFYCIFHLTYSEHNSHGFPEYKEFADIQAVEKFIEQEFVPEYL